MTSASAAVLPRAAGALSDDAARLRILDAVKELAKAPFTVQDVVAKTGLPPYEVESGLAKVVRDYTSDIDVDEAGNLVYRFPPGLVAREDIVKADAARRRKAAFRQALITFFKGWTVAMVIVYFIIYVVLLIAFLAALSSRRDSDSSSGRSRSSGHGGSWWWTWGSPWGYGGYGSWSSRRDTRRWNREVEGRLRKGEDPYRLDRTEAPKKPSLAERTWFHLFGTDGIQRNPLEKEKELLTYIRAKKGFISNADIIALLGVTYDEADAIGTRLVATYEGEMDLTDDGLAIYRFPNLMLTAAPEIQKQAPQLGYLWHVRAKEHALRSHPTVVVPALNVVNILLGLLTLFVIIPFFGWDNWGARIGLGFFPLLFSFTFLFLGLRRKLRDAARAGEYARDNMRIAIYQLLFRRRAAVKLPQDGAAIRGAGFGEWTAEELRPMLPKIAEQLRGEVDASGTTLRAPRILAEMAAVEKLRSEARSNAAIGRTVFTTRDDIGALPSGDMPGPKADASDQAAAIEALEKELAGG